MSTKTIVLLTDFGDSDPYVGIMKGVISQITPNSKLIDLSHQIAPGDIQEAAFQLWQSARYFPPATVFLVVVDPGVGTNRKGLFLQCNNQIFIGPDNGLFTYLVYKTPATSWELSNPDLQLPNPSNTFHGRDIFAPAAAYAVKGGTGDQFGEQIQSLVQLPQPICHLDRDLIKGEVLSIDRFGNLITSLGQFIEKQEGLEFSSWINDTGREFKGKPEIAFDQDSSPLPLVRTFAEIPQQSCAGLIGSSGMLEIAAQGSSAETLLGLSKGDLVSFSFK